MAGVYSACRQQYHYVYVIGGKRSRIAAKRNVGALQPKIETECDCKSSALAIKAASHAVAIMEPDASSRLGPNKCRACAFVSLTLKEWVLAASGFGAAFFNRPSHMGRKGAHQYSLGLE